MSVVIRLKVPIEMHYTVIPTGTSKVNSSRYNLYYIFVITGTAVDGADLKLAFAALTTVLLEAAKLDKDELSLR